MDDIERYKKFDSERKILNKKQYFKKILTDIYPCKNITVF